LFVVPGPLPRRCAPQVLGRGAQADACGAARCVSQVFDRGAFSIARCSATLSLHEKNNSVDVQRNRVNITGFICTVER
jgi:hypothetical protein